MSDYYCPTYKCGVPTKQCPHCGEVHERKVRLA